MILFILYLASLQHAPLLAPMRGHGPPSLLYKCHHAEKATPPRGIGLRIGATRKPA